MSINISSKESNANASKICRRIEYGQPAQAPTGRALSFVPQRFSIGGRRRRLPVWLILRNCCSAGVLGLSLIGCSDSKLGKTVDTNADEIKTNIEQMRKNDFYYFERKSARLSPKEESDKRRILKVIGRYFKAPKNDDFKDFWRTISFDYRGQLLKMDRKFSNKRRERWTKCDTFWNDWKDANPEIVAIRSFEKTGWGALVCVVYERDVPNIGQRAKHDVYLSFKKGHDHWEIADARHGGIVGRVKKIPLRDVYESWKRLDIEKELRQ